MPRQLSWVRPRISGDQRFLSFGFLNTERIASTSLSLSLKTDPAWPSKCARQCCCRDGAEAIGSKNCGRTEFQVTGKHRIKTMKVGGGGFLEIGCPYTLARSFINKRTSIGNTKAQIYAGYTARTAPRSSFLPHPSNPLWASFHSWHSLDASRRRRSRPRCFLRQMRHRSSESPRSSHSMSYAAVAGAPRPLAHSRTAQHARVHKTSRTPPTYLRRRGTEFARWVAMAA